MLFTCIKGTSYRKSPLELLVDDDAIKKTHEDGLQKLEICLRKLWTEKDIINLAYQVWKRNFHNEECTDGEFIFLLF